jgi:hypothetical protein
MKTSTLLSLILSGTVLSSCEDFFEPNLEKKDVTIIAPANNTVSTSFTQTFWWEELKGAEKYTLQIVRPSFSSVQQLILDTNVTSNKFSYTLQPGTYQWRLQAINNSSETPFVTYTLTIDSTLNLSGQTLVLSSPSDGYYTSEMQHNFSWLAMPNADAYIFQIFTSTGTPVGNAQATSSTGLSHTFITEGTFKWRVFAQNAFSSSAYSERTITIDTTALPAPVLVSPANGATEPVPVQLSWTSNSASVQDNLTIYADTNMTTLIKDTLTTLSTYNFFGTSTEDYFWRVRSKDAAGNWSSFSTTRKLIVQ